MYRLAQMELMVIFLRKFLWYYRQINIPCAAENGKDKYVQEVSYGYQ